MFSSTRSPVALMWGVSNDLRESCRFSVVGTIWRCSEEHGFTLIELLTVAAIPKHRRRYYMSQKGNLNLSYLHFSSLCLQELRFAVSRMTMWAFAERLLGQHEALQGDVRVWLLLMHSFTGSTKPRVVHHWTNMGIIVPLWYSYIEGKGYALSRA